MNAFVQRYVGSRRATLIGIAIAALLCAWVLRLDPRQLFSLSSFKIGAEFFSAAFQPAFDYERAITGADPFLVVAVRSIIDTFRLALLGISVAVPFGAVLAFFSSSAWWPDLERHRLLGLALRSLYVGSRALMAFARSIHELIWGLLFITAIGLSTEAAIVAVAIPYSGILAKIYAEMLDEHSRESQEALRAIGASGLAAFCLGLFPRALPDLLSYTFYRLECALRSAAVFGFIGVETIGLRIKLAALDRHYHEVWMYLYLLFVTCALIEWWGHAIRRRLRV